VRVSARINRNIKINQSGLSGKQDLYLVFTGQGSGMFNIDWLVFDKKVEWKK